MARNMSSKFGAADGFSFEDNYESAESVPELNKEQVKKMIDEMDKEKEAEIRQKKLETDNKVSSILADPALLKQVQEAASRSQKPLEIGDTRGRKGLKLPHAHLRFSEMNYDYLKYESRRRGLTMTEFINKIIEEYRNSPEGNIQF